MAPPAACQEKEDSLSTTTRTSTTSSYEHCIGRDQPSPAVPGTSHGSSDLFHAQYDNYVDLIDEDQDADFLAAIEASLLDQQTATSSNASDTDQQARENQSLNAILASFQADTFQQHPEADETVSIIISRKSVLQSTLRAIERKTFSFFKPVIVTFAGEEAVDAGGPKREFFRLLMSCIRESAASSGSWFSHDLNQLSSQKYTLYGKLVAWSVLQGGTGPRCLSSEGYKIYRGATFDQALAIEDVADVQMKEILRATAKCCSKEEFDGVITKQADQIAQYGYPNIYTAKLAQKKEVVDCLLRQNFVYGVHAEFSQFMEGMDTIGNFGFIVKENQSVFDAILSSKHDKLTLGAFSSLYELDRSEKGSNNRSREDSTIYCFELFLKDLEEGEADGLTLEDLLVFITGADSVPPLGFQQLISVQFYDFTGNVHRCPWSRTCALTLHLPRGVEDPQEFNKLMKESLLECHGFGKM